ncbi:helix-turn-helix domain-containing protein [Streptomyces longwoodensis]|uniref:helix-turn-helix domain-containing protein n=1 Tax=Streptomyces longwoodensis TaxID=68231 RepID=UPI002255DFE9|nr:helix-turn-helix transcriptional regulator [Streptomyces longwoodensis]MCX5000906.1 helix-turn-helix domain-containing protein [Streptomyces longwoodensis]
MRQPRSDNLNVSRTVGANVRALRTKGGWSQRALAKNTEAAGKTVGFSTICRMEKASTPGAPAVAVYIDDVVSLAATLNVTVQQLITSPACLACMDSPPPGFACRTCGAEA